MTVLTTGGKRALSLDRGVRIVGERIPHAIRLLRERHGEDREGGWDQKPDLSRHDDDRSRAFSSLSFEA